MSEISNLGYMVLGVDDLGEWEIFATQILGMQVNTKSADKLTLRMDSYLHRIILEKNGVDDLLAIGWEFDSEVALEDFVSNARINGAEIEQCDPQTTKSRSVERLYRCPDPDGYGHELYFGPEIASSTSPFFSSVLKGRFKTGDLGVGHLLPLSKNGPKTFAFYKNILKLRLSDCIIQEVAPGMMVNAQFFHTKTGRHHSIASAEGIASKLLNHIMIEVEEMDDVGLAYDRCKNAGYHIASELGHHPNDGMFSFYVRTPSGFNLEFGWGGKVIDEMKNWTVVSYSRLSDWGHTKNPYKG